MTLSLTCLRRTRGSGETVAAETDECVTHSLLNA